MQHHDVERMAFDPFAAIDAAAGIPQLAANGDAERMLHCMDRTHLVGNRTNAADPRYDIRRFGVAPATQERFKKSWRLKDFELSRRYPPVVDVEVERTFALDAGDILDPDRLTRHEFRSLRGTASRRR